MTKLATVLRTARQEKGLSLSDIEKLSDSTIAYSYVCGIERGAIPSPKKLRVLANILKLDFLELMILAGHVGASDFKSKKKEARNESRS